jgi:endonuclease YncB( thermonuclease family)
MRARKLWRRAGWGALAVLVLAALVALAIPAPARADRYSVFDGDTMEVVPGHCLLSRFHLPCRIRRLRLYGVDAFEAKQDCLDAVGKHWECGAVATERLRELVRAPDFGCQVDQEWVDRHAREFAVCTSGGRDVGALLVSEGLAFAYGRRTGYVAIENRAKAEQRGAWAGRFVRPQYFRAGGRVG